MCDRPAARGQVEHQCEPRLNRSRQEEHARGAKNDQRHGKIILNHLINWALGQQKKSGSKN